MSLRPAATAMLLPPLAALLLMGAAGLDGRPAATDQAAGQAYDQGLHDELLDMRDRDRQGRAGGFDPEGDDERTERLAAIIDRSGWPTYTQVGVEGVAAATTIAQHSDADPPFQQRALQLLTDAAARGQGPQAAVAELTDRLAVGRGDPQPYGTQVLCTAAGPRPATPIGDPAGLDFRRASSGLGPMRAYLDETAVRCDRLGS